MNIKYQIFVSSTYEDLKEHRDLAIKAILEMGHIPVGMEMFSAADEQQWSIIRRQIEQSDYYVVIIANRYGSVNDEGVSYTEKEYDYAVSLGVPTLGFILDSEASWPSHHTDTDPDAVSSLNGFKAKVKQKHVSFWKNNEDLYGKCSIALMKAFTTYPREGWSRSSQVTDAKMTAELTRLSAENADLRKKIEEYNIEQKKEQEKEISEIINIMRENQRSMHVFYTHATEWTKVKPTTLFSIFIRLAPELLIEKSIRDISGFAAITICSIEPKDFRPNFPVPSNSVKSWMADFSTLGLVKPSDKKKPVSDKNEYWTLTEKGKKILSVIRRFELEKVLKKEEPPKDEEEDS